jgi:hypothetical protein
MITNTDPRVQPVPSLVHFILFSEISMALFKLPLSGDVVQWINPVTWFLSGNQITANVYLGESGSPEVEAEILDRVGTYGRQLGQIADAMIVLLRHLPDRANLAPEEREAIEAFEKMANDIANIKEKHKRQAVRP